MQREKVERLKSWGYAIDYITRKELGELEPDIDLDLVGDAPITFCPEEGWIDPVVYANAMVKGAQKRGATLKTGSKVVDIETRNGARSGVKTADGAVARRRRGRQLRRPLGRSRSPKTRASAYRSRRPSASSSSRHPSRRASRRPIHSPDVHLRPDGAGRLMMRKNEMDGRVSLDMTPSPTMPQSLEVMRRAAELIPASGASLPRRRASRRGPSRRTAFPPSGRCRG